jgi:putative ABC transport system permease protein
MATNGPGRFRRARPGVRTPWREICCDSFSVDSSKGRDIDRELNEELASHIAMETALRVCEGESPEAAQQAALRQFGNVGLVAEVTRDQWGLTWLELVLNDIRYSARSFLRSPLFSVVVVITLALGIGTSTTIFSLLDGILMRALPFPDSNQLMMLWEVPPQTRKPNVVNLSNFAAWRERNHSFQSMAAFLALPMNLLSDRGGEQVPGLAVTADFFETLGTPPLLGRTFRPGEYWTTEPREVVLSYGAWQRLFGGRPDVIGKNISIDVNHHEIIGVMPPGFGLPTREAELYVPQAIDFNEGRNYSVIARLRPGISPYAANAEMATLAAQTAREKVHMDAGWSATAVPLLDQTVGSVRPILLILFAAVGLVLLLACANVANLLMMRASGRVREISVRLALGASRNRIVRQLLIESLLLAMCGGLLGVMVGGIATHVLKTSLPESLRIPRMNEVTLNWTVLLYCAGASILSALIFGLAPALQVLKRNVSDDLHESTRSVTSGRKVRRVLVIAEIALALVLVSTGGLTVRSFLRLASVDTGFHAENVLTARMLLLPVQKEEYHAETVRQMLDRIRTLPGVVAAGSIGILPMEGTNSGTAYYRADRPEPAPNARPGGDVSIITAGYFEAMRIPMIRGRAFDVQDRAGSPPVAILNQSAAHMLFPDEDAIGKRLKVQWGDSGNPIVEVVGVVADIRHSGVSTPPDPCLFMPNDQQPFRFTSLVVRTTGNPASLENAIREQIRAVDSDQGIAKIELLKEMVSDSIARPRLEAVVLTAFGVIALGLACIGLYGLIAFSVAQRAREIGIRVALGASKAGIFRMVLGDGFRLTVIGVLLGFGGVVGSTRVLRSLLFEINPLDPATLVSVVCILLIVSALACYIPALRATKADPATVLREE